MNNVLAAPLGGQNLRDVPGQRREDPSDPSPGGLVAALALLVDAGSGLAQG